jgi:hypothetical protein
MSLRIIAARITKPAPFNSSVLRTANPPQATRILPSSALFRQQPRRIYTSTRQSQSKSEIHHSGTSWNLIAVVAAGAAIGLGIGILRQETTPVAKEERDTVTMTTTMPPGRPGNLTAEQEVKLRELWALALRVFGVVDNPADTTPNGKSPPPSLSRQSSDHSSSDPARRKKGRLSLFRKKHKEGSSDDAESEASSIVSGNGTSTAGELLHQRT